MGEVNAQSLKEPFTANSPPPPPPHSQDAVEPTDFFPSCTSPTATVSHPSPPPPPTTPSRADRLHLPPPPSCPAPRSSLATKKISPFTASPPSAFPSTSTPSSTSAALYPSSAAASPTPTPLWRLRRNRINPDLRREAPGCHPCRKDSNGACQISVPSPDKAMSCFSSQETVAPHSKLRRMKGRLKEMRHWWDEGVKDEEEDGGEEVCVVAEEVKVLAQDDLGGEYSQEVVSVDWDERSITLAFR